MIDLPGMEEINNKISEMIDIVKNNTNQITPKFLPATKISEMFDIQTRTLSIYADKGSYKKYYFGDKLVYYKLSELYNFIENSTIN